MLAGNIGKLYEMCVDMSYKLQNNHTKELSYSPEFIMKL